MSTKQRLRNVSTGLKLVFWGNNFSALCALLMCGTLSLLVVLVVGDAASLKSATADSTARDIGRAGLGTAICFVLGMVIGYLISLVGSIICLATPQEANKARIWIYLNVLAEVSKLVFFITAAFVIYYTRKEGYGEVLTGLISFMQSVLTATCLVTFSAYLYCLGLFLEHRTWKLLSKISLFLAGSAAALLVLGQFMKFCAVLLVATDGSYSSSSNPKIHPLALLANLPMLLGGLIWLTTWVMLQITTFGLSRQAALGVAKSQRHEDDDKDEDDDEDTDEEEDEDDEAVEEKKKRRKEKTEENEPPAEPENPFKFT